jgi:hypothetical protein
MTQILWKTVTGSLAYLGIAVACLIQWNRSTPWLRLDGFAGGYFALRLIGWLHSIVSSLRAFRSRPLREEWWALNSAPAGSRWVMFLMGLDLLVFLDYGHWRFSPSLEQPALYLAVMLWQICPDAYLAGYFRQGERSLAPMSHEPYQYVGHPRYAAAIVGKVAMALTFASLFGWLLVIAWALLLLNWIAGKRSICENCLGRAMTLTHKPRPK